MSLRNTAILGSCCRSIDNIGMKRKWDIKHDRVVTFSKEDNCILIIRNKIGLYDREFKRLMNTHIKDVFNNPWFDKNGYKILDLVINSEKNEEIFSDYLDEMLIEILRKELSIDYLGIKIVIRTIENIMDEKYRKEYIL